jgi:tRNA(Arg) A34 adenosine deaminase TadA
VSLACKGVEQGQRPFAAALYDREGALLAEGTNVSMTTGDPFDHAEMSVIRTAYRTHGIGRLHGSTMYASGEPCSMCAGTILRFGIRRVVFGLPEQDLLPFMNAASGFVSVPSAPILALAADEIEVVGGVLPGEARRPFEMYAERGRY